MINRLHLSSFKCFERLDMTMRPLTLMSGTNGAGKSTVIQSLVLLSQTFKRREWGHSLILDGPDLALGCAADVVNYLSARRRFVLGVTTEAQEITWSFRAEERRALSVELENIKIDGTIVEIGDYIRCLLPVELAGSSDVVKTLRQLSWITAERVGPREILPLPDSNDSLHVGSRGDLAAGLLYWHFDDKVRHSICIPSVPGTLFHQVRARMQVFFPGCDIKIGRVEGASAVSLRLRTSDRFEFQRPQNVGFGLTQVFPILVAVLAAREGDLVIIENPEVHLHPRAQQDIGTFLSEIAASGVQILLETHSDHVLNGVRLAVRRGLLSPNDAGVHFFVSNDGCTSVCSPGIDVDGRLDMWPDGFFDQFDLALSELL